jgi:hypothetical protein
MDYLYVLYMILTVFVFIYVYYGLFICTNLVYVISLVFTVFSFHLLIFGKKNRPVSDKIHPEIATLIFEKITNLSVKSTD